MPKSDSVIFLRNSSGEQIPFHHPPSAAAVTMSRATRSNKAAAKSIQPGEIEKNKRRKAAATKNISALVKVKAATKKNATMSSAVIQGTRQLSQNWTPATTSTAAAPLRRSTRIKPPKAPTYESCVSSCRTWDRRQLSSRVMKVAPRGSARSTSATSEFSFHRCSQLHIKHRRSR